MKKWMKKLLTLCLALTMVVSVIAPVTAEAKTRTKSITLYKGETIYITDYSKVKSASSSKKSVVKAARDKKDNTHTNVYALKAGKSTVTIKTKYGTVKYVITVKNPSFTVKLKDLGNGKVLLSVKNNTKQTFDRLGVEYTIRDADGNECQKDDTIVYYAVAGKTVYDTIYYNSYSIDADISQSSAKVVALSHDPDYKYTNQSSKVTTRVKEEDDKLVITSKNTSKGVSVSGANYVLFYDAAGNIVYEDRDSFYLSKGAVDTSSIYVSSSLEYDHYEIKTVAYSQSRK